jgi:hypothetical protein
MKIGGVEVNGPCEEILVLPRMNGEDIVIRAKAVPDMDEFNTLCPEPKPRGIRTKKDGYKLDYDDPNYKKQKERYNELHTAYIVLRSLAPSEIEWATVKMDQPSTWLEWQKELKDTGFSVFEVNRIVMTVMSANALDEGKLEKAREVFLLGRAQEQEKSYGPQDEQQNMPSGEPVNG